jgi:hypothetical protein
MLQIKPPIGFGYSDGSFTLEISGGNMPPYEVFWRNAAGDTLPSEPLTYDNNKAVSLIKNLPEGDCYLRVEDANYHLAMEADIDSCGCMNDTLSYYMPQPPKLEVAIRKVHDILCFGSNEGEITSTAEGGVPFTEGLPYRYEWERDDSAFPGGVTLSGLSIGTYRLTITDANGISAVSESITLTQPEELTLQFQSADIKCSRDETGWAEVSVSGGTAPYTYQWSNGGTDAKIDSISRGKYMVWVHDANDCETIGVVEIVQANAIQVKAVLTEPTCFGGSDGKISISLSKGEPPYTYHWENGPESLVYTGLKKGSYTFTVTDAYGCGYETVTYDLGEPEQIFVDLGEDRELCKGQSLTIKAKMSEEAQSYSWYGPDGNALHTGEEFTLSEAGVYTVQAVTAKGCLAQGSVRITRDDRTIVSDFVTASRVPIHDEVYMVNISEPAPESIEWLLPEKGSYEVFVENEEMLGIVFNDYGYYTVGMRSFSGKCWETVYKSIQVMDKIDIDNYVDADEPMLKSFTISPNPANGRFTVSIEMQSESPVDLYLIDSGTGSLVEKKHLNGNKAYKEVFEVSSSRKGTYVIGLSAPRAKAVHKVILY